MPSRPPRDSLDCMRAIAPAERRPADPHAIGLPDALLDPAAYPDRPASVELRETHISWVFLAGETAYKVKKPVRLPFLDYGTLARRRGLLRGRAAAQPPLRPGRLPRGGRARAARTDGLAVASEARPARRRVRGRDGPLRRVDDAGRRPRARPGDRGRPRRRRRRGRGLPRRRAGGGRHAAPTGSPLVVEETLTTLAAAGAPSDRLAALARFCRAALGRLRPRARATARRPASSATATATCARSTSCSAPTSARSTASSSTATCASPTSATTSPS